MTFAEEVASRIGRYCQSNGIGRFNAINEIVKALYEESYEAIITSPAEGAEKPQNASESADMVNHPPHYKLHANELIDEIRAILTPEEFRGYLKGTFLKYRYRAGAKGDAQMDFDKSDWYMNRLMKEIEQI